MMSGTQANRVQLFRSPMRRALYKESRETFYGAGLTLGVNRNHCGMNAEKQ